MLKFAEPFVHFLPCRQGAHLESSGLGDMVIDNLTFRTAQKHVKNYEKEFDDLTADHQDAMDCVDCEAFLQLGIDAFDWLIRADQAIRLAISENDLSHSQGFQSVLESLCREWLKPCDAAEQWIGILLNRGYNIGNLEAFRERCQEMKAIVDSFDCGENDLLPEGIAKLRDAALLEHARGETAEFFPEEK